MNKIIDEKSVLFVVDMINGFCKKGALADENIMNIVPDIKEYCNSINNIYFIRDCHKENDIEFQSFPKHCVEGECESEIIEELQKYINKNKVIKKNTTNAFHSIKNIKSICEDDNNKNFIITGCCSDICILQFALSLKTYLNSLNINKEVIVPKNCISTFNIPNIHEVNEINKLAIYLMENAGIKII